jgi:hypothetical protein
MWKRRRRNNNNNNKFNITEAAFLIYEYFTAFRTFQSYLWFCLTKLSVAQTAQRPMIGLKGYGKKRSWRT